MGKIDTITASEKDTFRMIKPLNQNESDFVEKYGLMTQEDGQSRILGRIWGLLMLRKGPLDADEIAELLQISRGSVSTNMKTLLSLNVLERVAKPGERRDFYALKPNTYVSLIEGQIRKLETQLAFVSEAKKSLKGEHVEASLGELEGFYTLMHRGYSEGVKRYNAKKG